MTHPTDLLPRYAAGTLSDEQLRLVDSHLRSCRTCADDVAAWRGVAGAVHARVAATAPPPVDLVRRVLADVAVRPDPRPEAPQRVAPPGYHGSSWHRPLHRGVTLLAAQIRLVGRPVWLLAGALLLGGVMSAAWLPAGLADRALSTVVPLLAALAVAGACGTGSDPAGELVAASGTSPRTVLLARLTVVLGAMTGVAAVVSLACAVLGGAQPTSLVVAWLGPMALLSAVSFALAVLWRPEPAIAVVLGVWALRLIAHGPIDAYVGQAVSLLWQTTAPVLIAATLLVAVTLLLAPVIPVRSQVRLGG